MNLYDNAIIYLFRNRLSKERRHHLAGTGVYRAAFGGRGLALEDPETLNDLRGIFGELLAIGQSLLDVLLLFDNVLNT